MTWLLSGTIIAIAAVWVYVRYTRFGMSPGLFVVVWYAALYGLLPPFLAADRSTWNPRFQLPLAAVAAPSVQVVALVGLITLLLVLSFGKPKPRAASATLVDRDGDARFAKRLVIAGLLGYAAFLWLSGGPVEVLQNSSELRSTSGGSNLRILAAFFALSRHFLLFGAIYFSIRAYVTGAGRSWKRALLWLIVLLTAFLAGGRLGLINVFLAGGLVIIFGRGKIPVRRLVPVGLVAFLVGLYGKSVLFQIANPNYTYQDASAVIETTRGEGQLTSLAQEFSHPYLSLAQAMYREDYSYRFFGDYWYWAVKPLKLVGVSVPDSISYFNTFLTRGISDSEVPPGVLAFGFLSLGVVGVVLHVAVVGGIVRAIELRAGVVASPFGAAMLAFACLVMPLLIFTSDPALFLQNLFPMLLPVIWLLRRPAVPAPPKEPVATRKKTKRPRPAPSLQPDPERAIF